jgi:hypothetical protein
MVLPSSPLTHRQIISLSTPRLLTASELLFFLGRRQQEEQAIKQAGDCCHISKLVMPPLYRCRVFPYCQVSISHHRPCASLSSTFALISLLTLIFPLALLSSSSNINTTPLSGGYTLHRPHSRPTQVSSPAYTSMKPTHSANQA